MALPHKILLTALFCISGFGLLAQPRGIKGSIRNAGGQPVPYALIQADTNQIIYSDSLGHFSLPANSQRHTLKITAPGFVPKNIVLPFNFKEHLLIYLDSISGNTDFNPYEVIRLARFQRVKNEQRYGSSTAGSFKTSKAEIHKVPFNLWPVSGWLLPAKKDTGLVYFSEQTSRQQYHGPYNLEDSVMHFQAAGTIPIPDFTYSSDKDLSFYHEKIALPELGYNRYYTPLAEKALRIYDFKALGSYTDGSRKVFRIGFTPKRHGIPALEGYFDIYDSTYTIAYTNFCLKPSAHLEKLDSVRVEQLYYYSGEEYHFAFQKLNFHLGLSGYKGSYSSEIYYNHQDFIPPDEDENLNGEVLYMDSSAVTGEPAYWKKQRVEPLEKREKELLQNENLNDIFKEQYSRVLYIQQPFEPVKLLYNRYLYRTDKFYFHFNPLYTALGFNTVEGVYLGYNLPIRMYGKDHEWMIKPEVRYGFSDGNFKSRMTGEFTYDLHSPKKVSLEVGHVLDQFNDEDPISPLINTAYSLFFSRNHMKLYGKDYARAGYQLEITNGLEMQSSLEYASRFPVYNNSTFTISGTSQKFTPNNPDFPEDINANGFDDHKALTFKAQLAYQFHQRYKTINGKKINLRVNTPRLYLNYRQGIKTAISETHYSFLAGGITFNTLLGNAGSTRWDLSTGSFFNVLNIEFIDYQHFNGTQTFYLQPSAYYYHPIKQFSTLGYYSYSTRKAFVEAHMEHHFNGFLLSRLGFLRRTQAHTYFGANYLHNFTTNQFLEIFVGFDNIFNIMRVEIAGGLDNFTNLTPTFLVGIDFNLLYYAQNRKN